MEDSANGKVVPSESGDNDFEVIASCMLANAGTLENIAQVLRDAAGLINKR